MINSDATNTIATDLANATGAAPDMTVQLLAATPVVTAATVGVAPTSAAAKLTLKEDTPLVLATKNFAFRDADKGDVLRSVVFSALPTHGVLRLGNAVVTVDQEVSASDIAAGKLVYVPDANGFGTSWDTASFRVSDGTNRSVNAYALTFAVTAVNDAPTVAHAVTTDAATEGRAFSLVVPADTFADVDTGDTLTWKATLADGKALPKWLKFDAVKRTFSGTPADADSGTTLSVKLTVTDKAKATASTTFTLPVIGVNVAPTSKDAAVTLKEDTPRAFSAKDFAFADGDKGDAFESVVIARLPARGALAFDGRAVAENDRVAVGDLGKLLYTPAANGAGTGWDSLGFRVGDGEADSATYTIRFDVTAVNDAPVLSTPIARQAATVGQAFGFWAAGSFADPDAGDTLTWKATLADGKALPKWLKFDAVTGRFSGTPTAADAATVQVRVSATDKAKAATSGLFELVVTAGNQAPTFASPTVALTVTEDSVKAGASTAVDPEGKALSYVVASTPTHGVVTLNPSTGAYIYQPSANFAGIDSFKVRATDSGGATADQTVNVTVTSVDDVPVFATTSVAVNGTEDVALAGSASASDVDDALLAYAVRTQAGHGTVTVNASTGAWSYTPATNFHGNDSFVISATDAAGASAQQTVNVALAAVNDAPILNAASTTAITVASTGTAAIVIDVSDVDSPALALQSAILTAPAHGQVTVGTNGQKTYTPAADYVGADSFVVRLTDGVGGVTDYTVAVTVTAAATTTTSLDVDDDAKLSTARAFDASGGAFRFTDDMKVADTVAISNFGSDDRIVASNAGSTPFGFTSRSGNVEISFNDPATGAVTSITLVGIAGTGLVYDEASAERSVGFDFFSAI